MVLANMAIATIRIISAIDRIMIEGGSTYESIGIFSNDNPIGNRIDANGYLEVCSFNVIQRDFAMFNNSFGSDCDGELSFCGSLQDIVNRPGTTGMMLKRT